MSEDGGFSPFPEAQRLAEERIKDPIRVDDLKEELRKENPDWPEHWIKKIFQTLAKRHSSQLIWADKRRWIMAATPPSIHEAFQKERLRERCEERIQGILLDLKEGPQRAETILHSIPKQDRDANWSLLRDHPEIELLASSETQEEYIGLKGTVSEFIDELEAKRNAPDPKLLAAAISLGDELAHEPRTSESIKHQLAEEYPGRGQASKIWHLLLEDKRLVLAPSTILKKRFVGGKHIIAEHIRAEEANELASMLRYAVEVTGDEEEETLGTKPEDYVAGSTIMRGNTPHAPSIPQDYSIEARMSEFENLIGAEDKHSTRGRLIMLNPDFSATAAEIGRNIWELGLFRTNRRVFTFDRDGKRIPMTKERFATWNPFPVIDNAAGFQARSLTKTEAELTLHCDAFLGYLRNVHEMFDVRLPILRNDGTVELLKGYDKQSETMTHERIKYDTDRPLKDALSYLDSVLKDFPWRTEHARAAHLAAMMSVYCRNFFGKNAKLPMMTYVANGVGSGKSILARMAIAPVFGHVKPTEFCRGDEMRKNLETAALNGKPYILFDDVVGMVRSEALNTWLTSPDWAARLFHKQEEFDEPAKAMVFLAGNDIHLSPDLERRAFYIALQGTENPEDRLAKLDFEVDTDYLLGHRAEFLSCMWSIVRAHLDKNDGKLIQKKRVKASFTKWGGLIPAIVEDITGVDPLDQQKLMHAGDVYDTSWRQLGELLADQIQADSEKVGDNLMMREYTLKEIVAIARRYGLFDDILGDTHTQWLSIDNAKGWKDFPTEDGTRQSTEEEKWEQAEAHCTPPMAHSLSRFFTRYQGKKFYSSSGIQYQWHFDRERFKPRKKSTAYIVIHQTSHLGENAMTLERIMEEQGEDAAYRTLRHYSKIYRDLKTKGVL